LSFKIWQGTLAKGDLGKVPLRPTSVHAFRVPDHYNSQIPRRADLTILYGSVH